jgi:precorrin-2/cobalt-factor-2 C20-methyltransferase
VFLVEGDASTHATFGHLARAVRALAPEVQVEVLAGVPSFSDRLRITPIPGRSPNR